MLQGDFAESLVAFRAGLAILEPLAMRDPANTLWQRDLATIRTLTASVMARQGDAAGALAAARDAIVIAEQMAARDPEDVQWQETLSSSHFIAGMVQLLTRSDAVEALAASRIGLAIRERLVARDPENVRWQKMTGGQPFRAWRGSGKAGRRRRGAGRSPGLARHRPAVGRTRS